MLSVFIYVVQLLNMALFSAFLVSLLVFNLQGVDGHKIPGALICFMYNFFMCNKLFNLLDCHGLFLEFS